MGETRVEKVQHATEETGRSAQQVQQHLSTLILRKEQMGAAGQFVDTSGAFSRPAILSNSQKWNPGLPAVTDSFPFALVDQLLHAISTSSTPVILGFTGLRSPSNSQDRATRCEPTSPRVDRKRPAAVERRVNL